MDKQHLAAGVILIIAFVSVLYFSNGFKEIEPNLEIAINKSNGSDNESESLTLHVEVIDKTTNRPVQNAIVYIGYQLSEDFRCETNTDGKCSIEGLNWGSYAFSVYKKEYKRPDFIRGKAEKEDGKVSVKVRLEKKTEIPTSFKIEGTVIEVVTAEGTKSENHYYQLKKDDGSQEYIFNEVGHNVGFEEFEGREVEITGFRGAGFIGWQHDETKGIYVEEIKLK